MKLELDSLGEFVGEGAAITAFGTLVCEIGEIVGLEIDAKELLVAAQFLDLGLGVFL